MIATILYISLFLRELELSKTYFYKIFILVLAVYVFFTSGCVSTPGSNSARGPVISSVVAEHSTLYPLGNTNITCSAVGKDSSALNYKWVCNDGTITGSGPTINWEAPKTYGDFNIAVIVDDGRGNTSTGTTKVTVIFRDPGKCCK